MSTTATPVIEVDGMPGVIFEGELPDTFCFVPASCVRVERGETNVSEIDYVRSRWDERNMRLSPMLDGKRLFPKPNRPVRDLQAVPVRSFLARIGSG